MKSFIRENANKQDLFTCSIKHTFNIIRNINFYRSSALFIMYIGTDFCTPAKLWTFNFLSEAEADSVSETFPASRWEKSLEII